jgi:hypothetical protein
VLSSGHERAYRSWLVLLLLSRAVGGTFTGILVLLGLAAGAVEYRSDRFLARGVAGGDVVELLGGSWTFLPQFVNQGLVGGPGQESADNVGVGDVGQLVALLGEASDVVTEGLIRLLPIVLEVLGVPRARVCALEVSHEDILQVRPTPDGVVREVV